MTIPTAARAKAAEHAARFVADRARLFAMLRSAGASPRAVASAGASRSPARTSLGTAAPPLSVAPFDAELFGHFWHEGPTLLGGRAAPPRDERRARRARGDHPRRTRRAPPRHRARRAGRVDVGRGGFSATWTGPRTAALWRHVHHASAAVMGTTCRLAGGDSGLPHTLALEQAIVQTLLLQSSDFPFMIHRNTTAEYASRRVAEHAANARRLASLAGAPSMSDADRTWIEALRERTPFLRELPAGRLRAALTDP